MNNISCGALLCNNNGHCITSSGNCLCLKGFLGVTCDQSIYEDYSFSYSLYCGISGTLHILVFLFLAWRFMSVIQQFNFLQVITKQCQSCRSPTPLGDTPPISVTDAQSRRFLLVIGMLSFVAMGCRAVRSVDPLGDRVHPELYICLGGLSICLAPVIAFGILFRFISIHSRFDSTTRNLLPWIKAMFIILTVISIGIEIGFTVMQLKRNRNSVEDMTIGKSSQLFTRAIYAIMAVDALVIAIGSSIFVRTLKGLLSRCAHIPRSQWNAEQISAMRIYRSTLFVQVILVYVLGIAVVSFLIPPNSIGAWFVLESATGGIFILIFFALAFIFPPPKVQCCSSSIGPAVMTAPSSPPLLVHQKSQRYHATSIPRKDSVRVEVRSPQPQPTPTIPSLHVSTNR